MGIDIQVAKNAARGQWRRIATAMLGISDSDYLSGRNGPCPKCQAGTDRWRVYEDFDETGGVYCNQCGTSIGDGFKLVQWYLGVNLDESISKVCEFLGVVDNKKQKPKTNKSKTDNSKSSYSSNLIFREWLPRLFDVWAATKKPITEEGVKLAGGRFATYRGMTVIAIPIIGRDGEPNGHAIYNASGGTIPYKKSKDSPLEQLKVQLIGATKKSGWMGRFLPGGWTIKAEGVTDTLAILSANKNASVVSNPFGSKEDPIGPHNQWMLEKFVGEAVCTIHDRDIPGVDGATWVDEGTKDERPGWAPAIAIVAAESRNLDLPYPITENNGKDARDFLNEQIESGKTLEQAGQELLALVESAGIVPKPDGYGILPEEDVSSLMEESEDDPHRLARVNADRYKEGHNGKLVFWQGSWLKWKDGRYRNIDSHELDSKINAFIRDEFERGWRMRQEKGGNEASEKVRKVTIPMVRNTIAAMASKCFLSSETAMPCWIPEKDRERNLLSMLNGILDIDKLLAGEDVDKLLIEHSSHWFSTIKLPYKFDPVATCPNWLNFLNVSLEGDQQRIQLLQEWAGYLLLPNNPYQKFMALEGEGKNGKTVYFAGLSAMLGEGNISRVALQNFDGRFDLATTVGKMVNMCSDVSSVIEPTAEAVIRAYTGGEAMQFDRKNQKPIQIKPTAKLMFAWNNTPRLTDKSNAIWRRLLLVPFGFEIPEENRIYGMDESSYWVKSGEMPGILNWAINGLIRLRKENRFTSSNLSEEKMKAMKLDLNPARAFLSENVEVKDGSSIECGELYGKYCEWCKANGNSPLSSANLGKEVKREFPKSERKHRRENYSRVYVYENVCFIV